MAVIKQCAGALGAMLGSAALALSVTAGAAQAGPQAPPICDYSPSQQQTAELSAIDQRYRSEPALQELVGGPIGAEVADGGVRYREYEHGRLYWTEPTGVRESHGNILGKYLSGGHPVFGVPITDECPTADGVGRYNHFTGTNATGLTSVYWHPDLGAHLIWGPIRGHWEAAGWETSTYGYPTTDTSSLPDGGLFNHLTGGDGHGASIYWSANSGVHGVKGAIRDHWLNLGATPSYLGYPTSDEFDNPSGKRSNFQGGYITWNAQTGQVQDYPW